MSNYTGKKFNCKCITCGKEFHRKPSAIKRRSGRMFCSKECNNKDKSKVAYEKMCEKVNGDFKEFLNREYHQNKKGTHEIALEVYGRRSMSPNILGWMERLDIPRRTNSEAAVLRWVDNDERRAWQSNFAKENLSGGTPAREKLIKIMQTDEYKSKSSMAKMGSNNPMWDPNKTDEEREREKNHSRRLPGYKDFRRKVYERDNFTCKICGDDKGGNLVVHHINGFKWDVKNRLEVDNGVTLCTLCHKEFHSIYGYKDVNLFQFSQFLEYKKQALNN